MKSVESGTKKNNMQKIIKSKWRYFLRYWDDEDSDFELHRFLYNGDKDVKGVYRTNNSQNTLCPSVSTITDLEKSFDAGFYNCREISKQQANHILKLFYADKTSPEGRKYIREEIFKNNVI